MNCSNKDPDTASTKIHLFFNSSYTSSVFETDCAIRQQIYLRIWLIKYHIVILLTLLQFKTNKRLRTLYLIANTPCFGSEDLFNQYFLPKNTDVQCTRYRLVRKQIPVYLYHRFSKFLVNKYGGILEANFLINFKILRFLQTRIQPIYSANKLILRPVEKNYNEMFIFINKFI